MHHLKIKNFYPILLLIFQSVCLCAANNSPATDLSLSLLNYGAIWHAQDISGYYFFYKVDKADREHNNYRVDIYDNNFNTVNSFEIQKSLNLTLIEASYNGQVFLFYFLDYSKNRSEYLITVDSAGNQLNEYSASSGTDLGKLPKFLQHYYYDSKAAVDEYYGPVQWPHGAHQKANNMLNLAAVPSTGFLKFAEVRDKKMKLTGYSVSLLDNDLSKIWNLNMPSGDPAKLMSFQAIYHDDKYLVGLILKKEGRALTDLMYDVVAVDIPGGKVLFEHQLGDEKYAVIPSGVFVDTLNNQFVLMGEYTDRSQKLSDATVSGIAAFVIDASGNLKTQKYISETSEIDKMIEGGSGIKAEAGVSLAIQKIFSTSEGKIFAIAEQFKKEEGIKIMDLVMLELDHNFALVKVSEFAKPGHHVNLPVALASSPLNTLLLYMNSFGLFDFNFMNFSGKDKSFALFYNIAGANTDHSVRIGSLVYTPEGKFLQSALPLKGSPDWFHILPAKWGYLGLMEYYQKEQQITKRIEKLDY